MSDLPVGGLLVVPATGVGEVRPGDDLAGLLAGAWRGAGVVPQDGDVVAVTSKVVSKAEGRLVPAGSAAATGRTPGRRRSRTRPTASSRCGAAPASCARGTGS